MTELPGASLLLVFIASHCARLASEAAVSSFGHSWWKLEPLERRREAKHSFLIVQGMTQSHALIGLHFLGHFQSLWWGDSGRREATGPHIADKIAVPRSFSDLCIKWDFTLMVW